MREHFRLALWIGLLLGLSALALDTRVAPAPAAAQFGDPVAPQATAPQAQFGLASWYGRAWQGRRTASGVRFDARKLTAAHRTLPLNTKVRVTNLSNGRSVEVTINDRGPYVGHRMIDLSAEAAKQLDMTKIGVTEVKVETLPPPPESFQVASAEQHR